MAALKTHYCGRVFFLERLLFLVTDSKFRSLLTLSRHNSCSKPQNLENHHIFGTNPISTGSCPQFPGQLCALMHECHAGWHASANWLNVHSYKRITYTCTHIESYTRAHTLVRYTDTAPIATGSSSPQFPGAVETVVSFSECFDQKCCMRSHQLLDCNFP